MSSEHKRSAAKSKMRKWRNDGVAFVRERLKVEPEPEQIEILNAVGQHQRVSARSGHGIGKSTAGAFLGLWWLFTRKNSTVICTAPTFYQLKDILFAEFDKWLNVSKLAAYVRSLEAMIAMKGYEKTWRILARTSNKPENIAGRHAKYLLYIIDEASGINPKMDEAIEGALTEETNKLVMLGNPTQITGIFYDSHNKLRDMYKRLHFNSEKSKRVAKTYIKNMTKKYGKDSDIYRVRVLGEFPKGDPDSLIALYDVERAMMREVQPTDTEVYAIGVDPARYGNNESVIAVRHNNEILPLYGFYGINPTKLAREVAREVQQIRTKGYNETIEVRVDVTGVGAGTHDTLEDEQKELNIATIGIENGSSAENDKEYYNLGAETWSHMKAFLTFGKLPDDDDLRGQMTARKYKLDRHGRIQLESKEDMMKRGVTSPDRGDATALAITDAGAGVVFEDDFVAADKDYINAVTDVQ